MVGADTYIFLGSLPNGYQHPPQAELIRVNLNISRFNNRRRPGPGWHDRAECRHIFLGGVPDGDQLSVQLPPQAELISVNQYIYIGSLTEDGQAPAGTTGLNADTYIFLGGVPEGYQLPPQAPTQAELISVNTG